MIGWAYANFLDYNYDENFDLPESVLKKIEKILERIRTIKYADSFSSDFHKTGYMPYVSSMVVFKNKADIDSLARSTSTMSPLFHDENAYNPGKFTLETSRSAANMVATWLSLQTFGKEGYCALLARALCIAETIRNKIDSIVDSELLVVNKQSYGSDIFIRCYPPGVNSIDVSKKELHDESILREYSKYNTNLFAFLKKFSKHQNGIAVSKTSAAFYTAIGSPVVALRIYILNPFLEEEQATVLVDKLVEQKKVFDDLYSEDQKGI